MVNSPCLFKFNEVKILGLLDRFHCAEEHFFFLKNGRAAEIACTVWQFKLLVSRHLSAFFIFFSARKKKKKTSSSKTEQNTWLEIFMSHFSPHSRFDLCAMACSLTPSFRTDSIDFQWPAERRANKSQAAPTVLVSSYKAASRWWARPFTRLHSISTPHRHICDLRPKAFTFSWAGLCATGAPPVINIAAPVGSGSFKIVFLRPSH